MMFYYCHPPALYINKLRVAGLIEAPLNPYFERLFETGVDEMRWDDMSKNDMLWPGLREAHAYRRQVYAVVARVIDTHPDLADGHAPIGMTHPLWALFMGFEHERIHLETSAMLIHELPLELVQRPAEWPALHASARRAGESVFPPRAGHRLPCGRTDRRAGHPRRARQAHRLACLRLGQRIRPARSRPAALPCRQAAAEQRRVLRIRHGRRLPRAEVTGATPAGPGAPSATSNGRPSGCPTARPGCTATSCAPCSKPSRCRGTGRSRSTATRPTPTAPGRASATACPTGCPRKPSTTRCVIRSPVWPTTR